MWASLRANIPNFHTNNIKFHAFVGERLVSECLTRCADAFFEAGVDPEAIVAVSVVYYQHTAQEKLGEEKGTAKED